MEGNKGAINSHTTGWERIYDKVIAELKTNLVYVLVLVLGYCLYRSEISQNDLQKVENDIVRKERDEWRGLALKAIGRNFDYVDIMFKGHEYKNDSAATHIGGTDKRQ
jgi:hypothetical protein